MLKYRVKPIKTKHNQRTLKPFYITVNDPSDVMDKMIEILDSDSIKAQWGYGYQTTLVKSPHR